MRSGWLLVGWLVGLFWVSRPISATDRSRGLELRRTNVIRSHQPRHSQTRAGELIGIVDRVGEVLQGRFRSLSVVSSRFVGATAIMALIGGLVVGFEATVLAVATLSCGVSVARRRVERDRLSLLDELAPLLELIRIAVLVGYTVRGATEAAVRLTQSSQPAQSVQVARLDQVTDHIERGMSFDAALALWAEAVGTPADEVASLLASAGNSGTSITAGLANLAADLRRQRHHAALVRARRLPITMLPPLIFCVLPAFALVTVVPMVTVGLRQLSVGS